MLRIFALAIAEAVVFWGCLITVGFLLLVFAPATLTTATLP